MSTLQERVALVTGAAGNGMGLSIALTLAREGATTVLNYRTSAESAQSLVTHIEQRGGRALAVQADIFTKEGCARLVETTLAAYGKIDICIIGPGGGWHPEPPERLDATVALTDIQAELAPIYSLLPLVLPGMYERRWGRIIGLGLLPPYTSPAYSYNVGKAARTEALLLLKDQAWQYGVTVNTIGPGPVPEVASLPEAIDLCHHGLSWTERPTTSPQDIAEGVAFLCSDVGRFITGCILPYQFV